MKLNKRAQETLPDVACLFESRKSRSSVSLVPIPREPDVWRRDRYLQFSLPDGGQSAPSNSSERDWRPAPLPPESSSLPCLSGYRKDLHGARRHIRDRLRAG